MLPAMPLDAIAAEPLSTKNARADWLVPLGLVALGLIPALGGAARLASFVDARAAQADSARFAPHPAVLAAHIVAALTFSLLGALQFSSGLRRRRAALHRAAGRLLAPAGIAAALSGFATLGVFAAAPTAGALLHAMRVASGIALIGSIALGLAAVRRRDYPAHGRWMTRAYAIGVAPGTQGLVLAPLYFVFRVDTVASYTAVMALGWIVNAVVAEKIIAARARATPRPRRTPSGASCGARGCV